MIQVNHTHGQLAALWSWAKTLAACPHFKRAYAQLRFLCTLSNAAGGTHDAVLEEAARGLADDIAATGGCTPQLVQRVEEALGHLAKEAKSYEYLCVAHAHIDMNWMWGYNETVAATLDTFRTMLALLEEYPDFIFSQSQVSVYAIAEKYAPELFSEIQRRVREGRWEVTASTWVEGDKNMAGAEAQARQQLYARAWLREKFSIQPEEMVIDFEPDTFGHHKNVPEILAKSGVRFYYHCRGQIGEEILYRWAAPSGREVVLYTEPFWYNSAMIDELGDYATELSRITGSRTLLRVYGVGDHGGGPTRRDLDALREMNTWPLFPKFTFSALRAYFEKVEPLKDQLPLLKDEINFICDGCYTTQSVIKAGNRRAERLLREGEYYSVLAAALAGRPYPAGLLQEAWQKTLFNQFHDILPGSCTADSCQAASGEYQKVFAAGESVRKQALLAISDKMDTLALVGGKPDVAGTRGEGAGTGHAQPGHGAGRQRVHHLFNPLPWPRRAVVPLTVWDYEGEVSALAARDASGTPLACQQLAGGTYWDHIWNDMLVEAQVPAGGYTTLVLAEKLDTTPRTTFRNDVRVQRPEAFVLENEHLRVELDATSGGIASFYDKAAGLELADPERPGLFHLGTEAVYKQIVGEEMHGMSSWFAGRWRKREALDRDVEIRPLHSGPLRTAYRLSLPCGERSRLVVEVSLDAGAKQLCYRVECDWREFGSNTDGVPNLHFLLPLGYPCEGYRYDVPGGTQTCAAMDMDRPAQSYVLGENQTGGAGLALLSRDKYGVRCFKNSLALTLLRAAYDPDPTPDIGSHSIAFAVALVPPEAGVTTLDQTSAEYRWPPAALSGTAHAGPLPPQGTLLQVQGASLAAVKQSEDGKGLILRLTELDGKPTMAEVTLPWAAAEARLADTFERPTGAPCQLAEGGKNLRVKVPPYSTITLRVTPAHGEVAP